MNNLFRITKDNVSDVFIEYSKNKQLNQNNNINKTEQNLKKKHKTQKIKNNTNEPYITKSQYKPQINSIIPNFGYEKNIQSVNTHINKNFNCEIKKILNDNIDNIDNVENETKLKINKNRITHNNLLVSSNSSGSTNDVNKNKVILEYGKSGIKPEILKKSMSKNLNTLAHIDEMIRNFLDCNPKLNLNTLVDNNENNKNNSNNNENNENNVNNENPPNNIIYYNSSGQIAIENKKKINVELNGKKSNKKKKYNLVDFGYVKIYDVNFTEEFANKHKIPSFKSIVTFSDNIKHFLKLIKLLEYTDKYKIKINQLNDIKIADIIYQNLPSIITGIGEKKNLFNSTDKKFTFYIKITVDKTMAFIIDKKEKMLYFFNSIETNSSGYIFFYVLNIDSKYKIIDLNKIHKTSKKNSNKRETIGATKIKKVKQIVKDKSSSISDFSDSDKLVPNQTSLQN